MTFNMKAPPPPLRRNTLGRRRAITSLRFFFERRGEGKETGIFFSPNRCPLARVNKLFNERKRSGIALKNSTQENENDFVSRYRSKEIKIIIEKAFQVVSLVANK